MKEKWGHFKIAYTILARHYDVIAFPYKKNMVNDKVHTTYSSKFSQVWTKVLMRLVTANRLGNRNI